MYTGNSEGTEASFALCDVFLLSPSQWHFVMAALSSSLLRDSPCDLHPSCLSLFLCLACTLGFFPSVSCAPPDCPLPSREQHSLPPPFLCPLHLSSSEIVSFLSFPSLYNWFLCGCQVLLSSHHVLKKNKQTQQGLPGPCCALKINLVFLLLLVLSRTQAQHPLPHDELTGSCHSLF